MIWLFWNRFKCRLTCLLYPFQVIVPVENKPILSADFSLLESVEYEQRIKYILEVINEVEWVDIDPDDLTR